MNEKQKQHEKNQQLVRSVLSQATGTFSSRVLGLLRDALLGAFFSRTITDAWLVAFRLPNMFRRLFGEGALSVSFIPVFIDLITHQDNKEKNSEAFKLASGVFSIVTIVLSIIVILGIVFAEEIVMMIAGREAFLSIPGKFDLTVQMTQIMFVFCLFICQYAYFTAILNAFKRFSMPAFAPVLFNVAMIVSTLLPHYFPQVPQSSLAWGVVIGGFLQMAVLIPELLKIGYFPKISLHLWDKNIKKVFTKMVPGLLGMGIIQVTIVVNTGFAASLEEGANSWIFWADRLLELPLSLFAVSLGTALLPTLAQHISRNEREEMLLTSQKFLRMIFYVSIPCAVGIYILSQPIIEVLFKRGKFTDYDVTMTAKVLAIYSIAILAYSGVRVIVSSFYAVKNTTYPAVVSVLCLGIHIAVAPFLMKAYGVEGLVMSTVLSSVLNFLFLLIGYQFVIGKFYYGMYFKAILKFSVASAIMGCAAYLYFPIMQYVGDFFIIKLGVLFSVIFFSAAVYFGFTRLFKCEEYHIVFGNITGKLLRKFGK